MNKGEFNKLINGIFDNKIPMQIRGHYSNLINNFHYLNAKLLIACYLRDNHGIEIEPIYMGTSEEIIGVKLKQGEK